jgi:hypothetical protein
MKFNIGRFYYNLLTHSSFSKNWTKTTDVLHVSLMRILSVIIFQIFIGVINVFLKVVEKSGTYILCQLNFFRKSYIL